MRTPQRKILVVFEQRLGQLILLIELIEVGHDFNQRPLAFAVVGATLFCVTRSIAGRSIKATTTQQRKERLGKRGRIQARSQTLMSKLIGGELFQDFAILQT